MLDANSISYFFIIGVAHTMLESLTKREEAEEETLVVV
jgi:hypothetical protein